MAEVSKIKVTPLFIKHFSYTHGAYRHPHSKIKETENEYILTTEHEPAASVVMNMCIMLETIFYSKITDGGGSN